MLIQELFRQATAGQGPVVEGVATMLAPAILRRFGATPALGGSGALPSAVELPEGATAYTAQERERFSATGFDQSLATHIINGLFAGLRIAEHLPPHKALKEQEQRLWALGFTVHDYMKVDQGFKMKAGDLPAIRSYIKKLGGELEFEQFLADWQTYLDDLVYIAQNTQTVQGANLNARDFALVHPERRLAILRMLSSVVDVLVHITSPADVQHRDVRGRNIAGNLRSKLTDLFGDEHAPRLAYHKLQEVRGLLSNLLNNAVADLLNEQGYQPFLYFPEGMIYFAPRAQQAEIDVQQLTGVVWQRIADLLTGGKAASGDEEGGNDEEGAGGGLRITRTKDYLKVPPVFYELLSLRTLMEAGCRAALSVRNARAVARLGAEQADEQGMSLAGLGIKQKDELFTALGLAWAHEHALPLDVRVDQLAEYLGFLRRRIFGELFPKLPGVTAMLLDELKVADAITPERAEKQRSGTPTGWFYVAACYIKREATLDSADLKLLMDRLGERALRFIAEQGVARGEESATAQIFAEYARRVVEIDGRPVGTTTAAARAIFAQELQRYTESKANNKVICSLCTSTYDATEQDVSVVLFKPQQYSNKSPLDRSRVLRGICPICALEMMLRQVQQGLPGGKTQDQQPINLYLYPTYFFTAETASVIKNFENRLHNLNLFKLIFSHLERHDFDTSALLTYDDFLVDDDEFDIPSNAFWKPRYSENDLAALFFITFRPLGKSLTETDTWIIPTFFALALPLLLGVKCVATPSFAPIHRSASDFRETVRLDGPHEFTKYILGAESFRLDEVPEQLTRLLRLYSLHLDVLASPPTSMHWGQLTGVARDIVSDPLNVFQYLERRQRSAGDAKSAKGGKQAAASAGASHGTGLTNRDQERYWGIYRAIGGHQTMGFIGTLVDAYAEFYRTAKLDSAYGILRPLGTAIDVVVESDPDTEQDDLVLLVAGAVNDDQERVRGDQAEGFDPIATNKELGSYPVRLNLSRQKIEVFAQLFVQECFGNYCASDRAILRERTNRIRSAARFYYLSKYAQR